MTKTERLKAMYNDLKSGAVVNCNGCTIWIGVSKRKYFLFWECHGRSAERLGLNNLRWICKNISLSRDYLYTIIN